MDAVIFWSCAEYCDHSAKLTIKWQDKQVRTKIWSSDKNEIATETKTYLSSKKAYTAYKIALADAVIGGWKVLSINPKREIWEE